MHHFFVKPEQMAEGLARIAGGDLNHMKNALRMKPGEEFLVSDGTGGDFLCRLEELDGREARARILERREGRELPSGIWLYQGLPKSDKMELIVQKAAELGAAVVVPVATKNAVVKLDERKGKDKARRWQTIAKSACEQSKRSRIMQVEEPVSFARALEQIREQNFDLRLIPYENQEGMAGTKTAFESLRPGMRAAVLIGPEGGFDEEEVRLAQVAGVIPVSLGKRILRTETAALTVLAALMLKLEGGI